MQVIADAAQPAIARATAYQELAPYMTPLLISEVQKGLFDPDAVVRLGALHALAGVAPEQRWGPLHHLLDDPVRSVRIAAVSAVLGRVAACRARPFCCRSRARES
jgi:HEAT repeat protein